MARYRKIEVRIWNDKKFRSLDDKTKLVFFMLLTHPDTNQIGFIRARSVTLAMDLGWDSNAMLKAIRKLCDMGMLMADEEAGLMFLPNFLKYNPPNGLNGAKSWEGLLDLLPECDLIDDGLIRLKPFIDGLSDGIKKGIPLDMRNAINNAIQYANQKASLIQEQEQEQEQKQEQYINTNKQHTQVCNEGSAVEDGVCSDCFDEGSFDPDEIIDAPIKVQAAQAQLEHFDSVADDQPLSLAQLITGCKQLGIKLSHTTKTEAIASRETITKEVLRECAKAWKGTNTGTGYFVGILENASKDVNTVMPREKRELGPDTITDKQASFFASKLVRDSGFCSKFGKGYQDYNVFASKVAANIRNPRHFDEYKPYMERIGLLGGEQ